MDLDGLIINILREKGILTGEQIRKAEELSLRTGRPLLDIARSMKWVNEAQVRDIAADKFSMGSVSLSQKEIPDALIKMVPADMAHKYRVLPVELDGVCLKVAIDNPFRLEAVDSLAIALGMQIEPVLAMPSEINRALQKYYGYSGILDGVSKNLKKSGDILFEENEELRQEIEEEAPVIRLVSFIIAEAFKKRASDIHLEPLERKFRVRYRIDGMLAEADCPPKQLQNSIISRIKIMSGMNIDEKRIPQDGRIKLKLHGRDIDLRVSTVPGNHGESVVMRILDRSNLLLGLEHLGMSGRDENTFRRLIGMPNGIILVTGPTGSGKTTTLYACLNNINRPDKKIITVEDPVEYIISGINQVQVNEDIDLTFANVLRSILRQAPDVIMIGEIRDIETANISIHASLTGHLVFSTLHTNDACGAPVRLVDIGVKPFLTASSLQAVLAQRLVRTICPECREEERPSYNELKAAGIDITGLESKGLKFWRGRGCGYCGNTGYYGRTGIFELLVIDDEIRGLIYDRRPGTDIKKRARQLGMRTLMEDAMSKVYSGRTTLEEAARAAWE